MSIHEPSPGPIPLLPERHRRVAGIGGWARTGPDTEAPAFPSRCAEAALAHSGRASSWDACVDMTSTLILVAPNRASGWTQRSYALHALKRTEEARENSRQVVDRCPGAPFIH